MNGYTPPAPDEHGLYPWPWCCYCGSPLSDPSGKGPLHFLKTFCASCKDARKHAINAAIALVNRAIRDRVIPKPETLACIDCARQASLYEHRNYSRPLDVQPACRSCNRKRGPAVWRPDEQVSYESQFFDKYTNRPKWRSGII